MDFGKTNDVTCKGSTASSTDHSYVRPITRRNFKASGLDESEYFFSLEVAKKPNSHVTTARGNLASMFFGELSLTGSNFGEPEDSTDSPVSTKINALMADSTDMDEKFAMMEKTIEALKKLVDNKNLHIAQLMNKLEAYEPGELSNVPTYPPDFTPQDKDVEELPAKSKFQKEK
ncbi:hypothetical protein T459_17624 [Capsicum annuum]|uniref:Uncharacterized protein n=1 Tax=Capsicum annuum TaxID=4072 RepID=A0A2G2ZC40_CAPAN|nr:hypothetical protein T459_17624 [Capsicum annuum]